MNKTVLSQSRIPAVVQALFSLTVFFMSISALPALDIPALTWTQRSDWVNVVTQGADSTGATDSTSAIQSALNQVSNNGSKSAVYFPAGTYKISATLTLTSTEGATLVGCGRNTTLKWYGSSGGIMFRSNGNTNCRFIGLVWDGQSVASVGIDHGKSNGANYETRVTHRHEKFLGFTVVDPTISDPNCSKAAGIRGGWQEMIGGQAQSELLINNCYFLSNTTGVSMLSFNSLDNTFDGCEFQSNGYGIYTLRGDHYVRNCHFGSSSTSDIFQAYGSCSVRRCTSHASARFIHVAGPTGGAMPLTMQDCRVNGWTNTTSAVELCSPGPDTILDCVFTAPPNTNPPIRLNQMSSWIQPVIISNNSYSGTSALIASGPWGTVTDVGAGTYGGWTSSHTQSFLMDTVAGEGTLFDAVQSYGADNTGAVDATSAIQNCINAAKNAGGGAVAYIPRGIYKISSTLNITGSNYTVSGCGYRTEIRWYGGTTGTMISVVDPQQVRVTNFHIWANNGDSQTYDGVCRIRQTSSGGASSVLYEFINWGGYNISPRTRTLRGMECVSLPATAQVRFEQNCGNLNLIDCGRATMLANTHYDGRIIVEGATYAKTGVTGCLTYFATCNDTDIVVKDNQDLTIDDYYSEQTDHSMSISRNSSTFSTGHVTIQSAKQNNYFNAGGGEDPYITINNYAGRIFGGRGNFIHEIKTPPPSNYYFYVDHYGSQACDVVFGAAFFYRGLPAFREYGSGRTTHLLNNVWRNPDDSTPPNGGLITNVTNANTNGLIRQALDDSRLLGKCDLDLNHPTAGTPYITGSTPSMLRNNFGGFLGMKITVGSSPITVTDLGRYFVTGNTGTHTVKIVNGATGADVPNASVSISMPGGINGQFTYVSLASPVTLSANSVYHIVSNEVNGGDQWYDSSPVTTTSAATCNGGIYWNGFEWHAGNSSPYLTANFKYTIGPGTPYITGSTPSTLRSDFGGFLGMQITVGSSPITVTDLGRYFVTGNTGTHTVKIVNGSTGADVPNASVSVSMPGGVNGQFKYVSLASPVTLSANSVYYIVSNEVNGGDQWYNSSPVTTTSAAVCNGGIYWNGFQWFPGAGNPYLTTNFKYQ